MEMASRLIKVYQENQEGSKIKFLFLEITLDGLFDILFQGEHALPQQFIHVFKDGHFETTPVSHSGG